MLKKKIKYTDYNDNEREEDFYFNLTKAEVMEMEMSISGGLTEQINNVIAAQDNQTIIKIFKNLITKSYGKKSADGKRFIKNQEVLDEFTESEAFSNLFMELATNADAAAAFVNGVVPTAQKNVVTPTAQA